MKNSKILAASLLFILCLLSSASARSLDRKELVLSTRDFALYLIDKKLDSEGRYYECWTRRYYTDEGRERLVRAGNVQGERVFFLEQHFFYARKYRKYVWADLRVYDLDGRMIYENRPSEGRMIWRDIPPNSIGESIYLHLQSSSGDKTHKIFEEHKTGTSTLKRASASETTSTSGHSLPPKGKNWGVQVASCLKKASVKAIRKKLARHEMKIIVTPKDINEKTYYRVIVPAGETKQAAQGLRSKLTTMGFSGILVRISSEGTGDP